MKSQERTTDIEQYVIDFVRKLRADHNLNQEDIATIIGSSQAFVANIESSKSRAKYNLNHINLLADHFGISPQKFLPEKAV
ncbi:helix-turn-helix domain-containing protein [Pedobacter sp. HMF7647]|uniref:Helix-turn-helix domain-containing protein n=1 Tax=Hufsiella arboris TaxID=2695275 RepID=A0A7K1YGE1_9SPHI|nr:helix-turn-helix transcriptional regulator [Hufsiella arboris]MXV53268.1 helix-turn-helix domain-containing protein [Hufsiella arboris]